MADIPTTRRSFFGLAGGTALLCTIGGEEVVVEGPETLAKADAAAARVRRPRATLAQDMPQIQPQPGGRRREYWIQAETRRWKIVPTRRDEWHNRRIPGRNTYRAYMYREDDPGLRGSHAAGPSIPGPTLTARSATCIVVHFRNADRQLRQAVTMHPHGVKYSPEYDGAYMGEFTRAGGFVGPGETFTYQWECTPDSVGFWPYHDHGPNHTLNTFRGLFGMLEIRPRGAKLPDGCTLFVHQLPPPVTGLQRNFQCLNGRAYAGNTPTLRARVGQDVEINAFGMDSNFHTFHIHGHRWKDPAGAYVDNPTMGPNETSRPASSRTTRVAGSTTATSSPTRTRG